MATVVEGQIERVALKYMYHHMPHTATGKLLYTTQGAQPSAL